MREIVFDRAAQLLTYFLDDPRFRPAHIYEALQSGEGGFVFRGQADPSLPLLPSAHRTGRPFLEYAPQTPGQDPPWERPGESLGWQLQAELRASFLFLEQADRLGIPTSLDYSTTRVHVDLLTKAISGDDFDPAIVFPDPVLIPDLALAQHHGVPTRLLDWTEASLVAAYFAALEHSSLEENVATRPDHFGVFILRVPPGRDDPWLAFVSAPRHLNRNLLVQKGLFTYRTDANGFLLRHGRWPAMDDPSANGDRSLRSIEKAVLPSSEADELMRLLFKYDVTRHHLEPTLRNAAQAFSYKRRLFR